MDSIAKIMINNLFVNEVVNKYNMPPVSIKSLGSYTVKGKEYVVFLWKKDDDSPYHLGCCNNITEERPLPDIRLELPIDVKPEDLEQGHLFEISCNWLYANC